MKRYIPYFIIVNSIPFVCQNGNPYHIEVVMTRPNQIAINAAYIESVTQLVANEFSLALIDLKSGKRIVTKESFEQIEEMLAGFDEDNI